MKKVDETRKETKEKLIECADGKKRTKREYADWMNELMMKYN